MAIRHLDWIGIKKRMSHAEVMALEYHGLNLTEYDVRDLTQLINILLVVKDQRMEETNDN